MSGMNETISILLFQDIQWAPDKAESVRMGTFVYVLV